MISALVGVIWVELQRRITVQSESIAELGEKFDVSTQAVLSEKVKNLEVDYGFLHAWKNAMLPEQFARQTEAIINMIKQIEGDLSRRIARLDAESGKAYITTDDLRRYLDNLKEDRARMHEENSARLTRIDNELIRMHARIDEGFK